MYNWPRRPARAAEGSSVQGRRVISVLGTSRNKYFDIGDVSDMLSPETRRGLRQQADGRQIILKHRKGTMKIRLVVALAGFAIGFALPAFAQQKDTVDPQTAQQIRALRIKFDEAFNRNDAAAVAALYTEESPHC